MSSLKLCLSRLKALQISHMPLLCLFLQKLPTCILEPHVSLSVSTSCGLEESISDKRQFRRALRLKCIEKRRDDLAKVFGSAGTNERSWEWTQTAGASCTTAVPPCTRRAGRASHMSCIGARQCFMLQRLLAGCSNTHTHTHADLYTQSGYSIWIRLKKR